MHILEFYNFDTCKHEVKRLKKEIEEAQMALEQFKALVSWHKRVKREQKKVDKGECEKNAG